MNMKEIGSGITMIIQGALITLGLIFLTTLIWPVKKADMTCYGVLAEKSPTNEAK